MKIIQPICKVPSYTGITNLYHLFYLHNIREALIDTKCHKYIDGVFTKITRINVDFNISEPIKPDYLRRKDIINTGYAEYLLNPGIQERYDLMVVSQSNFKTFIPFMHRCFFIYVTDVTNEDPTFIPYTKVNDCFEGVLYVNDFHSMVFPTSRLDVFEQTYIRDKPYRFLKKTLELIDHLKFSTIVEIGSCRTAMKHDLDEINPMCCNDSHSTFFWCKSKCRVETVDINPVCERVLEEAYETERLTINGKLNIHIKDGLTFLTNYEGPKIDFLFLDAWDVVEGIIKSDYAEKHLEAYEKSKDKLADTCIIGIDDTDIAKGGKGRLLVPVLLNDGWTPLYKGRHSILYRGELDKLFA